MRNSDPTLSPNRRGRFARSTPARDTGEHARVARVCSQQLAYLGHELRLPVTAVVGMADVLSQAELAPEHRRCVETILSSCETLTSVVDSLMDFSRIQSDTLVLDAGDFDLQQLVDGVLDMLSTSARGKDLELAALIEEDVPVALRGDAARLRQVLINLLGNAVKFSEKGHVFLRVSCRRRRFRAPVLRFDVCDTGCGVSPSQKDRIFDAFVRADTPAAQPNSGVGLGLYIARALVARMGGEIGLDGAPGLGSTFWFTARFEKQPRGRVTQMVSSLSELDATALIVHPNPMVRRVLTRYAEDADIRVHTATDPQAALAAIRDAAVARAPYDLLFLDAGMGSYDILRITEAIREDERIPTPDLVLMTRLGDGADPLLASLLGRHVELTKPLTQSRFAQCVREVGERRRREALGRLAEAPGRSRGVDGSDDAPPLAQPGKRPRVLLVEDDAVVREVVSAMLRDAGCDVDPAADGLAAVRAAREVRYDAMFMDFEMPGLDGCQATREIRRHDGGRDPTPIIALTAHVPENLRERCQRAGMVDYLVKPVRAKQLLAVLGRHCRPDAAPSRAEEERSPPFNPAAIDRLRLLFLEDSRTRLRDIREAAGGGDLDTIAREAHALIGSAQMMGAARMSSACRRLETAALARRHGDGDAWPALREVEMAFERMRASIENAPAGPMIDGDQELAGIAASA